MSDNSCWVLTIPFTLVKWQSGREGVVMFGKLLILRESNDFFETWVAVGTLKPMGGKLLFGRCRTVCRVFLCVEPLGGRKL